ncbi:MAG: hypothetical protein LBL91_05665 [Lachnospiraceae bacterium]|nr:hypothetical protein [Lachnospiraceae bacterium]
MFIEYWIDKTELNYTEVYFLISSIAFLILSIDAKNYKIREIIVFATLGLLSICTYYYSKNPTIIRIVVILFCLKGKDINRIIKYSCIICSAIFVVTIVMSGIFGNGEAFSKGLKTKPDGTLVLGFGHPNQLQLTFDCIAIWLIYLINTLKGKRVLKLITIAILSMLNLILYFETTSKTGFIILNIYIIAIVLCKFLYRIKVSTKILQSILISVYTLIILSSIIFTISYQQNSIVGDIDEKILSNRLFLSNYFYKDNTINLFGNDIDTVKFAFDLGITRTIIEFGVIVFIIIAITNMILVMRYTKNKNYNRVLLMLIFLIMSVMENVWIYPFKNLSLLFIADIIFNSRKLKK